MEDIIDSLGDIYTEPPYDHLVEFSLLKIDANGDTIPDEKPKLLNLRNLAGNIRLLRHELVLPIKICNGVESLYGELQYSTVRLFSYRIKLTFINYLGSIFTVSTIGYLSGLGMEAYGALNLIFKLQGTTTIGFDSASGETNLFL